MGPKVLFSIEENDLDSYYSPPNKNKSRGGSNKNVNGTTTFTSVEDELLAHMSIADYETELSRKRNILIHQISNPIISREFTSFMSNSKSLRFIFFLSVIYTIVFLPTMVFKYHIRQDDGLVLVLVHNLEVLLVCGIVFMSWALYYVQHQQYYRPKSSYHSTNSSSTYHPSSPVSKSQHASLASNAEGLGEDIGESNGLLRKSAYLWEKIVTNRFSTRQGGFKSRSVPETDEFLSEREHVAGALNAAESEAVDPVSLLTPQSKSNSQSHSTNSIPSDSSMKERTAMLNLTKRISQNGYFSRLRSSTCAFCLSAKFRLDDCLGYLKSFSVFDRLRVMELSDWNYILSSALFMAIIIFHSIVLIGRVLGGECDDEKSIGAFINKWNCNPNANASNFPLDSAFSVTVAPILLVVNLRETRVRLLASAWIITVVALLACCFVLNSFAPGPFILIYVMTSFPIMADSYFQYLFFFLISRKLKSTLETNNRLADQNKATEMRHMIANVAHDLKTVSSFAFFELSLLLELIVLRCFSHFPRS
jgi:hypothetical protein